MTFDIIIWRQNSLILRSKDDRFCRQKTLDSEVKRRQILILILKSGGLAGNFWPYVYCRSGNIREVFYFCEVFEFHEDDKLLVIGLPIKI